MTPCATGWCLAVMPTHSRGNWVSTWQAKDMNPHMQIQTFESAYFIYPNVNLKLKCRTLKTFQIRGERKSKTPFLSVQGLCASFRNICVLVSTPSTTIMKFTVVLVFLLSNSIALDCTMKLWISETPCVSTSNSIAVENGTGSDEAAIPFSPSPQMVTCQEPQTWVC